MKFIKLTKIGGNDIHKSIVINASLIESMELGSKGKDTYIKLTNKEFHFVRESLDVVLNMLNTDYSKPPMAMAKRW